MQTALNHQLLRSSQKSALDVKPQRRTTTTLLGFRHGKLKHTLQALHTMEYLYLVNLDTSPYVLKALSSKSEISNRIPKFNGRTPSFCQHPPD